MAKKLHVLTKNALAVSAHHARQCHPETCVCGDDEGAIMDYKDDGRGGTYFGVVEYGYRPWLEAKVKEAKQQK